MCLCATCAGCTRALDLRTSITYGYTCRLSITINAVLRSWQSYVNGALGRTIQCNVGGCVIEAAEALSSVAAGVQSLKDVWGLRLQATGGTVVHDPWTVGSVVLYVGEEEVHGLGGSSSEQQLTTSGTLEPA
jgi:hypothetical protein